MKMDAAGTRLGTPSQNSQSQSGTNLSFNDQFFVIPSDLAEIMALWSDLPDHVKVGVVAMIKVAAGK